MTDTPMGRVSYGDDPSQFFELWRPQGTPAGVAVMIHGGFWRAKYDLSHANPFCAALASRGMAIANLEYRRIGQIGGGWPGSFHDVVAGVAAASARLGGTPVVIGHSAGGHLALRLTTEPVSLRAVVALAPVADLRLANKLNLSNAAVAEFLGASPEKAPGRYDEACPSKCASSLPRVLVHGTEDEDVPIAISRAFVEARRNDPVPPTLIEIPDAKHMDLIDPESVAGAKVMEIVLRLVNSHNSITLPL
jgi:acetyl esterase/lipase